jgi:hypothetical protein
MIEKSEVLYVTLDSVGVGSVQFTARKARTLTRVTKVTVEMAVTSSGRVSLFRVGQFLTSMPVAPRMEATGDEGLYQSEFLTGLVENGPISTQVKFTFFYTEEPVDP